MSILNVDIPRAFVPLTNPRRYKGAYGGRGGAKSHFFAEQLILRCYAISTRAVCIREVQNSLRESVRQLLMDKIMKLGLSSSFDILENEIRGPRGSLIIFKGMQAYNADNIKSLEAFDIAWIEEAQTFSEVSLRMLRPTLRKETSELWFSWNPRFDTDPVDKFFRHTPPPDSISIPVNWNDNPWFPEVLAKEKEHDYTTDPEMAEHVWGGGYLIISEGSYYARQLSHLEAEGRIGAFEYDPAQRFITAWDIGVDDYTAVWFIQDDGKWATVIDYYEASGEGAPQIVTGCMPELLPDLADQVRRLREIGREVPFKYTRHHLPHDVKVREWGAGAKARSLSLMECGVKPIHVGVSSKPADQVAAVRALLPQVRFANTPRVNLGLARLRRYSRRWNESLQTFGEPLHDLNSHGANAFAEYAMNSDLIPRKADEPEKQPVFKSLPELTYDEFMELEAPVSRRERA